MSSSTSIPATVSFTWDARRTLRCSVSVFTPRRRPRRFNSKLSAPDVLRIRERLAAGDAPELVAADFGVGRWTVDGIRSGRHWAWVEDSDSPPPVRSRRPRYAPRVAPV